MKVVETIIKEVKVKDVLTRYTLTEKPIDDLEQIGGLSAAAHPERQDASLASSTVFLLESGRAADQSQPAIVVLATSGRRGEDGLLNLGSHAQLIVGI